MPDTEKQQPGGSQTPPPDDPSKHDRPLRGPADPSSPEDPNQQEANKQAALARQAASKQVLQKLQDKYTDVHKTDAAMFPFEGVCLRCGWHTMELTEDAAKKLVEAHIAIHWRDAVTGIQVQGGSGLLGMEAAGADLRAKAMQAQEKGAIKGGQDALKPIQAEQKQRDQKMTQLAMQFGASASQGSGGSGQQSHQSEHGGSD